MTICGRLAKGGIRRLLWAAPFLLVPMGVLPPPLAGAADTHITVASTTSTRDSGLFKALLPKFEKDTGIDVHVVAVGTGQALKLGKRGDADVVLVHAKPTELRMIEKGYFVNRHDVMYNDFVVVGPKDDPADIDGMDDASKAFQKIAQRQAAFFSRGDNSGTNKKELTIWETAGVNAQEASGSWYRETGSGMGATLNTTAAAGGYTLVDRGTWINFDNRRDLTLLVEGDDQLFNQYGVMLVNPKRHQHVKNQAGMKFVNWLCSGRGQEAVAGYRLRGQQLFTPNCNTQTAQAQ